MSTFAGQFMVLNSIQEFTTGDNAVAIFNDTDLTDTPSSFTASIDWGDGSAPTSGTVTTLVGGFFTVSGSHGYADEGSPQVSVTLTRTADQDTATASGTVTVTENDHLDGFGTIITRNLGQAFSGPVAFFTDVPANVPGDFTASIDWGDGQTTTGIVSGANFNLTVSGAHTYTVAGQEIVKVTLADDPPGGTASATATTAVNIRSLSGQMVLNSATEGTAVGNVIATFSDTDSSDGASDFSATINWGDGATTLGFVGGSAGSLTVSGGHTYTDEGNDTATVTLTHTGDGLQATASGNVAVAEGDVLTPHGTTITSHANQAFNGFVATFSDSIPSTAASDFAAQIDWGDGQSTSGTVVTNGFGSFTVMGAHTYTVAGQDTVRVTLADDAPGTASATATTTATIAHAEIPFDLNGDGNSDLVFQNNGQAGVWLMNGTSPIAEAGLGNPGPSWHIVGSRDLNGDGNADLIWQNTDGTGGIWLMNGTTPIAELGFASPGASWHIVGSGDLNGDGMADLVWQNSDGTLGVWLMNGTTPFAEAGIGNPGTNWKVVGTADYNTDGRDDILLQNTTTGDLRVEFLKGTTVTGAASIAIGDPSWHAVSTGVFNGQTEIAWQNSDGTPAVWLMNGTTPVAEAALPNPGPAWQVVSIDHFAPNGQAGLLFQNTNGAMGLWQMNGTTIVAETGLLSPSSGWQSVNGHPFASG